MCRTCSSPCCMPVKKREPRQLVSNFEPDDRWGGGQRALQRWEPAPGEEALEELESSANFEPGWNQFELNEAKFGVQSTWDEVRAAHVPSNPRNIDSPRSSNASARHPHCLL